MSHKHFHLPTHLDPDSEKQELPPPSSPEELDTLLNCWFTEFQEKQQSLMNQYGLGSGELDYLLHESECILEFAKNGNSFLRFEIIPLGSWSKMSGTWKWSFQDQRYQKEARQALATAMEKLGQETGLEIFIETEAIEIELSNAELLIGSAVHGLSALGAYSIPSINNMLRSYYAIVSGSYS